MKSDLPDLALSSDTEWTPEKIAALLKENKKLQAQLKSVKYVLLQNIVADT